jgi:hypothetical protein
MGWCGDFKSETEVVPEPHNDYPMTILWNPVFLKFKKVRRYVVPTVNHLLEDFPEGMEVLGRPKARHIFCYEPIWLFRIQNVNPKFVKAPKLAQHSKLFPDQAEVVTRKSEGKPIDGLK